MPFADRRGDGARRRCGRRATRRRLREHAGVEAGRVDVAQRRRELGQPGVELGRRARAARARSASTSPSAAVVAHARARAPRRPRARSGPASRTVNAPASRARRSTRRRGRASRRWIGRTQSWSAASSTTRRHDRVGARIVLAGGGALGAVGARGLEAVVTVGEHERRARDRGADRVDRRRGSVMREQRVVDALVVACDRESAAPSRGEQRRQPGGERQAPDRVEVGAGGAEQLEPVALGLRQRALVGEDVACRAVEGERADHAGGACARARRHRSVKSIR